MIAYLASGVAFFDTGRIQSNNSSSSISFRVMVCLQKNKIKLTLSYQCFLIFGLQLKNAVALIHELKIRCGLCLADVFLS